MTEAEAQRRLTARCQFSELCTADLMRMMTRWQMTEESMQRVASHLADQGFVDHRRYAQAFVHDKFYLSHWGARRIELELRHKGIEPDIIDDALTQIDEEETLDTLQTLLQTKRKTVKGKTPYEINTKLMRFAANRGFSISQIRQCLDMECDDECDV